MTFVRGVAALNLTALALVVVLLFPIAAQAQIGLSHSKKGGAYLSVEGGYQNRDNTSATAPQAGGTNPYASGDSISERAIASPDGVSASVSASRDGARASGSAGADRNGTSASGSTQQSAGDRFISTGANTQAATTSTSAQSNTVTSVTGRDIGPGSFSSTGQSSDISPNASATSHNTVSFDGTWTSRAAAAGADSDVALPRAGSAGASQISGTDVHGTSAASSAAATVPGPLQGVIAEALPGAAETAYGPDGLSAAAEVGVPAKPLGTNALSSAPIDQGRASVSTAASISQLDGRVAGGAAAAAQLGNVQSVATFSEIDGGPTAAASAAFSEDFGPQVFLFSEQAESALTRLGAEDGGFGGVALGYVLPHRMLGLIDRVEAYGAFSNNSNTDGTSGVSFGATSADGEAQLALFDTEGLSGSATVREDHRELGLRFKSDNFTETALPLIVSFEPFYRNEELTSEGQVGLDYAVKSEIDADMVGAQLALETETPLLKALSFVGRVSAGVYGVSVDSKAFERVGTYALVQSDDDSATGYRLGAEAGVRLQMNDFSFATLTAAVDHFSDAPEMVSAGTLAVDLDEQTDYQAKLNLTFRAN